MCNYISQLCTPIIKVTMLLYTKPGSSTWSVQHHLKRTEILLHSHNFTDEPKYNQTFSENSIKKNIFTKLPTNLIFLTYFSRGLILHCHLFPTLHKEALDSSYIIQQWAQPSDINFLSGISHVWIMVDLFPMAFSPLTVIILMLH